MPKFVTSNGKLLTTTNAGGALLFSAGANSGVVPPTNDTRYQLPNTITFECWVNPQQPASGGVFMLLFFVSRLATNYQWYFRLESSGPAANRTSKLAITHYGTGLAYTGNGLIASDRWTHVAFTFNKDLPSGQLRFYVNGEIDAIFNTGNVASATLGSPLGCGFGFSDSNGAQRLLGLMDNVRLWNYNRSAAQILANYRLRTLPDAVNEVGLIGDYGFDETGTIAFDRSGQAAHAAVGRNAGGLSVMARQGSTAPFSDNTTSKLQTV
ncbi:hypothetical protein GCM10023185_15640 [Hymenobacter saemangeumensis]|uniref:LamG-like jellyroll fold domain-containing protein n=1 Tax=Hymenobacter saemangeumensis TaxID=1084522 RepID=A0ABP8I9T0_9BACT